MIKLEASIIAVLFFSAVAGAAPCIEVGSHYLLPDRAGQEIYIYVTGADPVQGLEFNARIGDGIAGPTFENVDILTGTIFESNNQGVFPGSYIDPRDAYQGTTTPNGITVAADGLLATITLDTTGLGLFGREEYDLSLIYTPEGRTNFAGVYVEITDGVLIIPEPTSLAIMLLGAGLILRRRQRRPKQIKLTR